jgi:PIN domain nuclease of toxin-antitoxin system
VRLLLDTHSFLWFIGGDLSLTPSARRLIEDPANQSLLSTASLWEMAIKLSIGKLSFNQPFKTFIPAQLSENGIELLDIKFSHLVTVAGLPFHHRDPFDRLLVAQAMEEQMSIISADPAFDVYAIRRLW